MHIGDVVEFEVDQVVSRQDHMSGLGQVEAKQSYARTEGSTLKSMQKPLAVSAAVAAAAKPPIPTAQVVKPAPTVAAPVAAPAATADAAAATAAPGVGMMDKVMDYAKKNPVIVGGVAVVLAAGAWWFWSKRRASAAPVMGLAEMHAAPKRKRRKSKSKRKSKK